MVLRFQTRESTRDVDVAIVAPAEASKVRELALRVAAERNWPNDWLNDGAKGYLVGVSAGLLLCSRLPGSRFAVPQQRSF